MTIDVTDRVGETDVTYGDLVMIGSYVLNSVNAAEMMRHASPAGLLEYAEPDTVWAQMVQDFIAWTSRGDGDPARDRLLRYVHVTGWSAMKLRDLGDPAP